VIEKEISVLALTSVSLPHEEVPPVGYRSAVTFLDYVIDGVPIRSLLGIEEVGVLSKDWDSKDFARRLVLDESTNPDLGARALDGRAIVYGCRECLSVDCGGVAVKVTQVGNRIRWGEFEEFSTDWERCCLAFTPMGGGGYEFDVAQYRSMLEPFL
jgi:hypothetical protein